jgi:signal transduction histidine kinase
MDGEVERLARELEEALERQAATADVLEAINRSGFDLNHIMQMVVATAARLCRTGPAGIFLLEDGVYRYWAGQHITDEYREHERQSEIRPGRGTVVGRAAIEKNVVQIIDALADEEYEDKDAARIDNLRTMLGVPLLREGVPIGVFALARQHVEPFSENQIQLVTTFANQVVVAISSARLFDEVQARTRELAASLENLRAAQSRLVQTEKLASLGQLTAGIAHEIKNPLNFVNNFSAVSAELVDELNDLLEPLDLPGQVRGELDEIRGLLKENLAKVIEHGKRADSIVKNMLLHSREGSGEHRVVDLNRLVEESLHLAYHGARAETPQLEIAIGHELDPAAGEIEAFPQEITRVLLNLLSNGIYAATRRASGHHECFEPQLVATTRGLGSHVEIRIRDNGTGIDPAVREKIFNPFFTTKPAGEGTGLGLSMSHDIIVKQHGGTIDFASVPGEFTEFTIRLPRKSTVSG